MSSGEPVPPNGRQTKDMTASPAPDPASHARHDLALVAALVDRDVAEALRPTELVAARAQVAQCAACAAMHRDLLDLTAGLVAATPPARPRDFRLTVADAARLQPRGWRRFLSTVGSARDGLTRPLAIGLTTLGLVGVLIGSVPGGLPFGGGTAGAVDQQAREAASAAPAPANQAPAAAPEASERSGVFPDALGTDDGGTFQGAGEAFGATAAPGTSEKDQSLIDELSIRDDPTGVSALVVIAGTLLILGLGLFALRWSARRFG